VVQGTVGRYVITAAHCLPNPFYRAYEPPPGHVPEPRSPLQRAISRGVDRLSRVFESPPVFEEPPWAPFLWKSPANPSENALGPLGQKPSVWAQCIFMDPIVDLAVLASPGACDFDARRKEEGYDALVNSTVPLPVQTIFKFWHPNEDEPELIPAWIPLPTDKVIACVIEDYGHLFDWRCAPLGADVTGFLRDPSRRDMFPTGIQQLDGSPVVTDDGSVLAVFIGGSYSVATRLSRHLPAWLLRDLEHTHRLGSSRKN
jgi:hypothetical protein